MKVDHGAAFLIDKDAPNRNMALILQFVQVDGRVSIFCYVEGDTGKTINGWMDPADLATFRYPGDCAVNGAPFIGSFRGMWNVCVKEARDAKVKELEAPPPAEAATPAQPAQP